MFRHLIVVAAVSGSLLTSVPAQATSPTTPPLTMPCFKEPARWNAALDGPLPRCPVYQTPLAS